MTQQMERTKKTPLLLLLLSLPLLCAISVKDCPRLPLKNLTCYNDYNRVITCTWNSTFMSEHPDTVCTIHAGLLDLYSSSCILEPVGAPRSMLSRCSVVFNRNKRFQSFHNLTISVNCDPVKHSLVISYLPFCHIKLNPPTKPEVNQDKEVTFSWFSNNNTTRVQDFRYERQWKQANKLWNDPTVKPKQKSCGSTCNATMIDTDQLTRGERYEARVRVLIDRQDFVSTWSDWSPTASWVSEIEGSKRSDVPDITQIVLGSSVCVVAIIVMVILMRTDKATWDHFVKVMKGRPELSHGSFLRKAKFPDHLYPNVTSQSFHFTPKPEAIDSVELTCTEDVVMPRCPEVVLLEKMKSEKSYESSGSGFSNPSYSHMTPPLPISSLIAGNLKPCDADAPYGPVCRQGEGKDAEQDGDEVRRKELEIQQLLSKGNNERKSMMLISDYEKVEKPQVERFRLQSLDSGVCSGEEVSQESLEADSINGTDCHDDHPEGKEERQGRSGEEVDFKKLFGGTVVKGSIQVCSGYEQVQKPQADSPELPSVDSGVGSGGEEQASQEEDDDKISESTSLLFSPPPPLSVPALACSSPSLTPLPFIFPGAALSPILPSDMLERIALMSVSRSVEPSGDGYMPVRQEQS